MLQGTMHYMLAMYCDVVEYIWKEAQLKYRFIWTLYEPYSLSFDPEFPK